MNKTIGLKAKNRPSKRKKNDVAKPTLASLLTNRRTPEEYTAFKKHLQEVLGEDDDDAYLYDDIEKNRAEIIERNKLTLEHIKNLQDAWREIHGTYNENLKNDLTK